MTQPSFACTPALRTPATRPRSPISALRSLVAAGILLALPLTGCKQGAGDRCQLDTDCGDGLQCVLGPQMMVSSGGVCEPMGFMGTSDMGPGIPPADMAPPDMAFDMTPPPEAGAGDAAIPDMTLLNDLSVLPDLLPLLDLVPPPVPIG